MDAKKITGLTLILCVVGLASFYFFTTQKNKTIENENKQLKNKISYMESNHKETMKKVKRLDENLKSPEQEKIKARAREYLDLAYAIKTDVNDEKRYNAFLKIADKTLIDKYYGKTRKSPIIFNTSISNVNVYTETFTTLNKEYKVMATLTQDVKDGADKHLSTRDVAVELKLIYQNDEWIIKSFKQFEAQEIIKEK